MTAARSGTETAAFVERVAARVDRDRLRTDVETTGEFGRVEGTAPDERGRTALACDDANGAAREYLDKRLEDAGLSVRIDAVGNVVGRWTPPDCDPDAAPVATGSHLDSVPRGGLFDGPLGVYAGLEAVRAVRAALDDLPDRRLSRPIEVVSFTEEEGHRFSDGLLGSTVAAGHLPVGEALDIADDDGIRLGTALERIGFDGSDRVDAGEWDAWIELHVEQARRLERAGVPIGTVTAIAGRSQHRIEVTGEADHAGTTPMADRADALAAASELVAATEAAAEDAAAADPTAVATVGGLDLAPNTVNVVPGEVTLELDLRAEGTDSLEAMVAGVERAADRVAADRPVAVDVERHYDTPPTAMSSTCRSVIEGVATALDIGWMRVHSGAGHDTVRIADVTDVGMLFVPSENGVSHSPGEWTSWKDCATGARVLAGTLAMLAREP